MQVMVIGSYRPHEVSSGTVPDGTHAFVAAHALGAALAANGDTLLTAWSASNLASQLGFKPRSGTDQKIVGRHRDSHPYWETADWHALLGFLATLEGADEAVRRNRIVIEVAGLDKPTADIVPFPHLSAANIKTRLIDKVRPTSVFPADDWVDLCPLIANGVVQISRSRPIASGVKRQQLLIDLVARADAVIEIGGGKASGEAADVAAAAGKLVLPSPASTEGALTEVERTMWARQVSTHSVMRDIAARTGGRLEDICTALPAELPAILSVLAKQQKEGSASEAAPETFLQMISKPLTAITIVVVVAALASFDGWLFLFLLQSKLDPPFPTIIMSATLVAEIGFLLRALKPWIVHARPSLDRPLKILYEGLIALGFVVGLASGFVSVSLPPTAREEPSSTKRVPPSGSSKPTTAPSSPTSVPSCGPKRNDAALVAAGSPSKSTTRDNRLPRVRRAPGERATSSTDGSYRPKVAPTPC